jgi:glycosyltransferase involved in cell wall biosynthesis
LEVDVEMRLEILMSVMDQADFSIAHKTKVKSDLLIINQCDVDRYDEVEVNGHTWRMISTTERGLSKSRNMALDNARGDVCLFCDDDEELADGYEDTILNAYGELPSASAIVFNVKRINYAMKKTYYRIEASRRAPAYRSYSSPMLTFLLSRVNKNKIRMNEKFGSGTPWGGGEENLFQDDMKHCGMKIYEHPAEIATIDYGGGSAWFHGYTEKYFYNLGAFLKYKYRANLFMRELRCLYTCYKLRRERGLSPFAKLRWMHKGMKVIKRDITYDAYIEGRK